MIFYKITKEQAELIGLFEYEPNKVFNPFVGEQVDGCFIIEKSMYDLLKDTEQFKKIDFTKVKTITELNLKPYEI